MVLVIAKTFDFDAAHWLPQVPEDHKCRRMHGHTYRVEVRVRGGVRSDGFVCDYADIAAAWQPIHDALDHRLLNEIPGLENPTTEVLVVWIAERLKAAFPEKTLNQRVIWGVRVYESTTTWVEWTS